jgi:hypothetical protein
MRYIILILYIAMVFVAIFQMARITGKYGVYFKFRDLQRADKFWFAYIWFVVVLWFVGIVFAICTLPISQ